MRAMAITGLAGAGAIGTGLLVTEFTSALDRESKAAKLGAQLGLGGTGYTKAAGRFRAASTPRGTGSPSTRSVKQSGALSASSEGLAA